MPPSPPASRKRWRPLAAAVLFLLFTAAGIAAFATYRVYRALTPSPLPSTPIQVYLIRDTERSEWKLEMIGPPGSNESFDPFDPLRTAYFFILEQDHYGYPRTCRLDSRIGPLFRGKSVLIKTERAAFARSILSDAIRSRQLPWPRALADADSCRQWSPANLLLNGLERSTSLLWLLLLPFACCLIAARRAIRAPEPGHCPSCNYNLRGLPASTPCPECGA